MLHDLTAVNLYGTLTDTELDGDHLVGLPCGHALEHLGLSRGELGNFGADRVDVRFPGALLVVEIGYLQLAFSGILIFVVYYVGTYLILGYPVFHPSIQAAIYRR